MLDRTNADDLVKAAEDRLKQRAEREREEEARVAASRRDAPFGKRSR